jgi:ankyrin repeat protein
MFGVSGLMGAADTRLFDSIRTNDVGAVKALLASGIGPNTADETGVTPLMYSAAFSSMEMMQLLLDWEADINAANNNGSTALILATGDSAKVRLLLDRGAAANARNKDGTTALMAAARSRNIEALKDLLARGALAGAPANEASVFAGIAYSREDSRVLDVLAQTHLDLKPINAAVPGILFMNLTNTEMARKLLATGAGSGGQLRLGRGPITLPVLGLAAFHGNVEVVRAMINDGVDPNIRGSRGFTPLMMAAAGDVPNPDVVRFLIERGAKVQERDENGHTALDWALIRGETPVASILREAGAPAAATLERVPVPASKPRAAREAIQAALARLQPAGPTFFEQTGCISCHNQSLPAVAVAFARKRGLTVDQTLAVHPAKATLDVWRPRAERSQLGEGPLAIPALDIAYGLWEFAEEGMAPNTTIDSVVVGLANAQGSNGAWRGNDVRPPLSGGSPFHVTALAIRALKAYAPPALRPAMNIRIARAVEFLRSTTPADTQDEAFKLLGLVWDGAPQREVSQQAKRLLGLQRANGGWGQLRTMGADAYATGQALYALAASGESPKSAAYKKGVQYLLSTQLADGTWFVRSRAFGFQVYFETGFPHGRNQFISTAATAWAAIALVYTL